MKTINNGVKVTFNLVDGTKIEKIFATQVPAEYHINEKLDTSFFAMFRAPKMIPDEEPWLTNIHDNNDAFMEFCQDSKKAGVWDFGIKLVLFKDIIGLSKEEFSYSLPVKIYHNYNDY